MTMRSIDLSFASMSICYLCSHCMPFILKPQHLLACQLVLFSAIVSGSLHVQQGIGCSVRSSDFAGHSTKAVRATAYYTVEDMSYVLQIQGPEGHGHFFPCCMEAPWCTYSALGVFVSMCRLVDNTIISVGQKGAGSLDEGQPAQQ